MLDIGLQELLLILVIALLVFGPKRLPELGRAVGRAMREFRRASEEFRSTIETNLQINEPDYVSPPVAPVAAEPPSPAAAEALASPAPDTAASPPAPGDAVSAEPYLAQRGARLFHSRECTWTGRIAEVERVYFKRAAEARDQGLSPCPVCAPWEPE
ncbi:MAG: twin-arginine translocase subunit TatB [Candidatus Rokubacteria bacterium]|nr:twin-arginine translocase subunit TatB [Candidatus Rokubacteria bacterium]